MHVNTLITPTYRGTTQVFGRGELFRRHMGNLDLIVNMHNNVEITLLPVERPLLQQQLDRIDQLLAQGIGGESHKLLPQASKSNIATKSGTGGGGGGSGGKGAKKKAGQNPLGSKKSPGKMSNAAGGGLRVKGGGYRDKPTGKTLGGGYGCTICIPGI